MAFDEKKFADQISGLPAGGIVRIPIETDSDEKQVTFTTTNLADLNMKNADLVIQTDTGSFTLSSRELDLIAIIAEFKKTYGQDAALEDLKIKITIGKADQSTADLLAALDAGSDFQVAVPPIKFIVTAESSGKVIQIGQFETFVERSIVIPASVDLKSISTAIVVDGNGDAGGRIRQVPTKIMMINGVNHAVFQSLQNAPYALISNPVAFPDAKNRWFEADVNDLGARAIISGIKGEYQPDRNITRAEFASILVNSLGLPTTAFDTGFVDLEQGSWFTPVAETAASYGFANGISDTRFGGSENITRQQAMTMICRAMRFTGIYPTMSESEIDSILTSYSDAGRISVYARASVAICLKTGVANGKTTTTIDPRASISRAEVAAVIHRLLQKSNLI